MTQIGQFTRTTSGYAGHVRTLSFDLELVLVPVEANEVENAPDYRIHVGADDGVEVGAGWKRTGERTGDYVSLLLDDPTFFPPDPRQPVSRRRRAECMGPALDTPFSRGRKGMMSILCRPLRQRGQLSRAAALAVPLLLLVGAANAGAPNIVPLATQRYDVHAFSDYVAEAAQRFGIPAAWIFAVMQRESGGDPSAVSRAGAMGLMQIMPTTWRMLRSRYGLGSDPYDPHDNILAGAAYLHEMHDRYGSPGFLAAYNAGPDRYDAYLTGAVPLPAETIDYVAALTPVIGGDDADKPTLTVAVDRPSWSAAPLFVALDGGAFAAAGTANLNQASSSSSAAASRDDSANALSGGGLFVRATASGATP
jgi:uncharacterized protein (DUF736 family)